MKLMSSVLSRSPGLNLVTGPINSGKSWFMQRVLDDLDQEKKPAIVRFNMRDMPFVSVDTFLANFNVTLQGWYEKIAEVLKKVKIEVQDLSVQWQESHPKLTDVFQSISEALPNWSILHGMNVPVPILFIDEVNLMRDLARSDPNGHTIIKSIFTWFIAMTKERRKFHVILSSSDSSIHNWLGNFVGNDRFYAFVLGHLSKKEAEEYWNKEVACNGFYGRPTISFEEIYNVCGGSMFLLTELYQHYVLGGIHPTKSFYIYQARMKLVKAMAPENPFYRDPLKSGPRWKEDDLINIVDKLVHAKGDYVYYDDLRESFGQHIIDSLIEYNVLHLRPYFALSKDLVPLPIVSESIVTAESPIGMFAMRALHNKHRHC